MWHYMNGHFFDMLSHARDMLHKQQQLLMLGLDLVQFVRKYIFL